MTWSVSGGGALSGSTTTSTTYNAPATVTAPVTATVTATSVSHTGVTGTAQVMVTAPPLVTTTGNLTAGTVGTAYSETLAASGGAGTLKWSLVSGSSLPTGLSLSSAGVISGSVTAPSTTTFTVQVTDSSAATPLTATSGTLSLTMNPAPLAITAPTLSNAVVGKAYTSTAYTTTGGTGTITWSASGLPAGLGIDASTGVISGTPTTAGTSSAVVVTATDSGSGAFLQTQSTPAASMTVYPVLSVGALASISAVQNATAINLTAAASGGSGTDTWSATGLPAGVSIASGTGLISGTPTASGSFSATITATDSGTPQQTASTTLALTVTPQLSVTAPTLANAVQATAYTSAAFTSSGGTGSVAWSATGLPTGLSIDPATGVISGTAATAGTSSNVVVTATDSGAGPLQQTKSTAALSLTVIPTLAITTSTLPAGTVGAAYSATLAASGGVTAYTWTSDPLPAGLTLDSATGVISGTPTATASSALNFTATDAGTPQQTKTASLTLTITPGTPVVTSTSIPSASINTAYNQALTFNPEGQSGAAVWAVSSGTLPAPFTLNATTGVISGTPTVAGGPYNFSVTVTVGTATSAPQALTFSVLSVLTVTSAATLPTGTVGTAYSTQLQAAGGSGTGFSWSLVSGTLPPGLANLASSGAISFTPTTAGTYNFTVQVTDSAAHTATQAVTLTVNPAPPVITTTTLPNASVGVAYNQQLAYSYAGTGAATWAVTSGGSSLTAAGLSMDASGLITGTPGSTGSASFGVTVTVNAQTSSPQTLTVTVVATPVVSTSTLPTAYVSQAYSATLTAAGGSGSGYSWTVTSGQTLLTQIGLSLSSGGVLSGTPAATGSGTITVQVKDSANQTGTATLALAAYTALSLPAANPASLPSAQVGSGYHGSIMATGGKPGYTWTVNGSALATNGTPMALTNGLGLSVTSDGSNTLSVSGTPSSSGTVSFTAAVADGGGASAGPVTYTINATTTHAVSGNVALTAACTNGVGTAGVTLTANSTPPTSTTTGNNGNFSLTGLTDGSYTVTPSITGASSAFMPATQTVTVNGADVPGVNFNVSLGYTVSGTVSYSGSATGRIYVTLYNNNCGNNGQTGVSIATKGAFTIRGVAPGTYNLVAWMDTLGQGAQNASSPTGTTVNVVVGNTDVSGADVAMTDPSAVTLTSAPKLNGVLPMNNGALVAYKRLTDGNGLDLATSYVLEWSTSSSFTTIAGSHTFAVEANGSNVWLLNSSIASTITDGSTYYFRLHAVAGSSISPDSSVFGPVTIGAPTGGNTITGTVTFSGTATGPLYTGFFDLNTGILYGEYIANPVSPQAYSVQVPSGSNYLQVGVLDQNNNGIIDAGDINNVTNNNSNGVAISAPGTMNLTLSSANATASVTTQHWRSGTNDSYWLNFQVTRGVKQPVSVALASGPNVVAPVDVGICGTCGNPYKFAVNLSGTAPTNGDAYKFDVTYSDGTSETLTATVTGVLNVFATNLSPTSGSSTTPTFTWTDPASASSYIYSFQISDNNGSTIWQIPGNNSNTSGFDSSITSISWGTDPTGGGSSPTVGTLTTGVSYQWQIQLQDANGNQSIQQVNYKP